VIGVIEDRIAEFRQLAGELLAVDVELLELLQDRLGLVLFFQALVDHRGAVGELPLGPRVNDFLFGGFVHGEQPPKFDEGLLSLFPGGRQGFGEQ
jgi:hypothetical protein